MYTLLLTSRYLFRKLTPLIGMLATLLCVGLIIVVSSIMGGFLDVVLQSGKTVVGDVVIQSGVEGFTHYEELSTRLEALDEVKSASPTINTFGLLKMDFGNHSRIAYVEVVGIKADGYAAVTGYRETLSFTPESLDNLIQRRDELLKVEAEVKARSQRLNNRQKQLKYDEWGRILPEDEAKMIALRNAYQELEKQYGDQMDELVGIDKILLAYGRHPNFSSGENVIDPEEAAIKMDNPFPWEDDSKPEPIVLGLEINPYNKRNKDARYTLQETQIGSVVNLTIVPLVGGNISTTTTSTDRFVPVNNVQSGFFMLDNRRVYIPFDDAQFMSKMTEVQLEDEDGNITGVMRSRASQILVRAEDGVRPEVLKEKVEIEIANFRDEKRAKDGEIVARLQVDTWAELQKQYLGPIEKEKALVTFLFGAISFVVVGLTIVIFYMIVLQKTRDIGILRSLGASQIGIAGIFLVYALMVSIIGAGLGTVAGALIVTYINPIHGWLGQRIGIDLFPPVLGLLMAALVFVGTLGFRFGQSLREKWFRLGPMLIMLGGTFTVVMITAGIAMLPFWFFNSGDVQVNWSSFTGITTGFMTILNGQPFGDLYLVLLTLVSVVCAVMLIMSPSFVIGQITLYRKLTGWITLAPVISALLFGIILGVILIYTSPSIVAQLSEIRLVIWDKQVYYFDKIPNTIDWYEVAIYNVIAVIASVLGAGVPAIIAAKVNPVTSLRYE